MEMHLSGTDAFQRLLRTRPRSVGPAASKQTLQNKSLTLSYPHPPNFLDAFPHTPRQKQPQVAPGQSDQWAAARDPMQQQGAALARGAPSTTSTHRSASCASTPRTIWAWASDGGRACGGQELSGRALGCDPVEPMDSGGFGREGLSGGNALFPASDRTKNKTDLCR